MNTKSLISFNEMSLTSLMSQHDSNMYYPPIQTTPPFVTKQESILSDSENSVPSLNISSCQVNRVSLDYSSERHTEIVRVTNDVKSNRQKQNKKFPKPAEIITAEEYELSIKDSPAYYLGLFIDSQIIQWLSNEASIHATSTGRSVSPISEEEMRCFIAIVFLSGYVDVPRRRMLWERTPDAHCPLVANAMQRDRFETIFAALHAADGIKDESERILQIKPLIQMLNNKFLKYMPLDEQHSIAECMIPGQTKHHNAKTISKGVKVWCGCTKHGYCTWFEPSLPNLYSTVSDRFNQLLSGRSAILTYASLLQRCRPSSYHLLFESVYAEVSLMSELQRIGVKGTGADRDKSGCLLNPALGGVDRMDCNVGLYRSSVRGKKTYSVLVTYALDLTMHNAWQLYRLSGNEKKPLDLLGFRRNIVIYYLEHYAKPIIGHRGGRPTKTRPKGRRPILSDARFDGIRHYVIPQEKQTRCAKCTAKTTTRCQKCDVGVHVKCFVEYHTRPK